MEGYHENSVDDVTYVADTSATKTRQSEDCRLIAGGSVHSLRNHCSKATANHVVLMFFVVIAVARSPFLSAAHRASVGDPRERVVPRSGRTAEDGPL
jgi:hypothetical protein